MGRRVRFRATNAQVGLLVGPMGATWALLLVFLLRAGVTPASVASMALMGMASELAAVLLLRWRGLELTAEHAVLRGDLAKRVPWSQVRAVRTERRWGTTYLVLDTVSSGARRCTAPFSGLLLVDPHLAEKVAFVQRWWLGCAPPEVRVAAQGEGILGWGHPVPGSTSTAR